MSHKKHDIRQYLGKHNKKTKTRYKIGTKNTKKRTNLTKQQKVKNEKTLI